MTQEPIKDKLVKCPMCKEQHPKSTTVEHGKRYYCQPCYAKKSQPKPRTDWDDLYDTIKSYYGTITPMMYKQLKTYREDPAYKFTDAGMRLTLIYYHEILGRPVLEESQTLGILPYIYEDAKRYYGEIFRLSQIASEQIFVVQQQEKITNSTKRQSKVSTFDFEAINWEECEC